MNTTTNNIAMPSPSLLKTAADPLVALCEYFNLRPTLPDGPVGPTFNMLFNPKGYTHLPTHVLAATQPDNPSNQSPLMLPINSTLFELGFPIDMNIHPPPPNSCAPFLPVGGNSPVVALPVIHISVPHPSSLPLLLLFGMRLEGENNLLAYSLLPVNVVEEFPNAAAMASILSRKPDERFDRIYRYNHGMWKNVLALGLNNPALVQLIQTAWNVTAEARRIRRS